MGYLLSTEAGAPSLSSENLVDQVIEIIKSNMPEMTEWFYTYVDDHRLRISFDLDLVQVHMTNGKLLELGSIPPILMGALRMLRYDICGIDIAPERFSLAITQLDLDIRKCNIELEKLPISDNSIDTVIFFELFEHLRIDLIFTMKEIFRVMRSGGTLLLSTPNLKSLNGILNFLFRSKGFQGASNIYNQYQKLHTLGHMGHVREYSVHELSEFLMRIGFRVKEVIYRGYYGSRKKDILLKLFPKLRRNITIVATK